MKLNLKYFGTKTTLDNVRSYKQILQFVRKNFSIQGEELELFCLDGDGDRISLNSDIDLKNLLEIFPDTLEVIICEKNDERYDRSVRTQFVEDPEIVEVIVEKKIPKIQIVEKIVEIFIEVPEVDDDDQSEEVEESCVQQIVFTQVPVIIEQIVEQIIEVPKIIVKDQNTNIVKIPKKVEKIVEKIIEVPQTVVKQVNKIVEVPVKGFKGKKSTSKVVFVEKPVQVTIEVPVIVQKIVERFVQVPKIIQKIVEVPQIPIIEKIIDCPIDIVEVPQFPVIVEKVLDCPRKFEGFQIEKIVPKGDRIEIVQVPKNIKPPIEVVKVEKGVSKIVDHPITVDKIQPFEQKIVQLFVPSSDEKMEQKMDQLLNEKLQKLIPSIVNQVEQKVNQNNSFKQQSSSKIFHNVKCCGCGVSKIEGIRYKCTKCVQFDLCQNCQQIISHNHNMIKMKYLENQRNQHRRRKHQHRDKNFEKYDNSKDNIRIKARCIKMAQQFGNQRGFYKKFVKQTLNMKFYEVKQKYIKQNKIIDIDSEVEEGEEKIESIKSETSKIIEDSKNDSVESSVILLEESKIEKQEEKIKEQQKESVNPLLLIECMGIMKEYFGNENSFIYQNFITEHPQIKTSEQMIHTYLQKQIEPK